MKQSSRINFYKKPVAASIAAALMAISAPSAMATNFQLGDFDVSFDSTFSLGSSWRIEDRNWNDNVGKANNVNNGFNGSIFNTFFC